MTRVLLLLLAVVGVSAGQQTFEIRGTVTEPGLGGIAGAEVSVYAQPVGQLSVRAFTNARGEFTARLPKAGTYTASAKLDGYFASHFSSIGGAVDADHPVMEARLEMLRFAEMTGRVVDAETREPLKGIPVRALQQSVNLDGSRGWRGVPMLPAGRIPTSPEEARTLLADNLNTDAGGVFRLGGLRPGAYVAAVIDERQNESQLAYSPEQARVIDSEYERVYWPGGLPPDVAVPQEVPSGGVFNVGEIRLKKVPMYRVHVRIPQGDCPEGESLRVSVLQRNVAPRSVGVFPCGKDALLRGFVSGSYTLYAVSDWQGERDNVEAAVWATATVSIDKENAEATLEPRRGVVLKGRIIAGEGVTEVPKRITLAVRPVETIDGSRPPIEEFIVWGENGEFRLGVGTGQQTLFVGARVVKDSYVSKLFYNGSAGRDLTIDVKPGERQDLEIVVDNKFASLEGTVEGMGIVTLWQKDDTSPTYVPVSNGSFQIKVPPGEYRIEATENGRRPSLQGSKTITLKPGTTERVVLRVGKAGQ